MTSDWLWDRKISDTEAKKILKNPDSNRFLAIAALLLSRKNSPKEIFRRYIDPLIFCRHWTAIKRRMRQDKWSEPRIIYWQAIYEKLSDRYRKAGIVFRKEAPQVKEPLCYVVGKKIGEIRREQGLSQKELAKKIRVSQQLISRIEKGKENISLGTLVNVAHALSKKAEVSLI